MLEKILTDLNSIEGILGSLVTGRDGLIIAQRAPAGLDVNLASALAASIFGTCNKAVTDLKQGKLVEGLLEGSAGKTLFFIGKNTILLVLTTAEVNLGLVRIEMERCIEEIEESL